MISARVRVFTLLLLLLLRTLPACAQFGGAPAVHLMASVAGGGTFTSAALNTANCVGAIDCDLIVIAVVSYDVNPAPALTDSAGNTWSGLTAKDDTVSARTQLFYKYSPVVSASHTFTLTADVSGNGYAAMQVMGWVGGKTAATPFDQESGATTTAATTLAPGSVLPSEDNELVIAALGSIVPGAVSVNSGFTISDQLAYSVGNNFSLAAAYLVQTAAAGVNPQFSWGGTANAASVIATFKSAVGGGAVPVHRLMLVGAGE